MKDINNFENDIKNNQKEGSKSLNTLDDLNGNSEFNKVDNSNNFEIMNNNDYNKIDNHVYLESNDNSDIVIDNKSDDNKKINQYQSNNIIRNDDKSNRIVTNNYILEGKDIINSKIIEIKNNSGSDTIYDLLIRESKILYKPFSYNKTNGNISAYIYSINCKSFDSGIKYGIIFPEYIGEKYSIKLYNKYENEIIYFNLIKENDVSFNLFQIYSIIKFHLLICYQLIEKKKIIFEDFHETTEEFISKINDKKYYIVPLLDDKGEILVNGGKIMNYLEKAKKLSELKNFDNQIITIFFKDKEIKIGKIENVKCSSKNHNYIYKNKYIKDNNIKIINNNIFLGSSDNQNKIKLNDEDNIFDQKEKMFFKYIPSLFLNFEQIIKIYDLIIDFNLYKFISIHEIPELTKKLYVLQNALSLSEYDQDEKNEFLIILGDSILNFIFEILLCFIKNENSNYPNIENIEREIKSNEYLFNISYNKEIYNYIIHYPKNSTDYIFPLKCTEFQWVYIDIKKDELTNLFKSIIAGMFIYTKYIQNVVEFLNKCTIFDILDNNKDKKNINLMVENLSNRIFNLDSWNFPKRCLSFIEEFNYKKDMEFLKLLNGYIYECNKEGYNYKYNSNSIKYFQYCKIFRYFWNYELLKIVLKKVNLTEEKNKIFNNCKKLGKAIIDFFITYFLLSIKIEYNNRNNNTKYNIFYEISIDDINSIKQLLFSDYYITKLFLILEMYKFVNINGEGYHGISTLNNSSDINYIKQILNSSMDNDFMEFYLDNNNSDVFFSLIGAILVDSEVFVLFRLLFSLFAPGIVYYTNLIKDKNN